MNVGYARMSYQDQNLSLQLEALQQSGCMKIYQEKAIGAKVSRPELANMLEHLREGDTVYIWKLAQLARSLKHLIDLVKFFDEGGIGLISVNDPIDTTMPQGRLIFRLFASLAEFEHELLRERTQAGLASARLRGQQLGRKVGLSKKAISKAKIAERLYKEGKLPVVRIAKRLGIAKATLYVYLKHQGVKVGGGECSN